MTELNLFYDNLPEPNKSCFLALRKIISEHSENITEHFKYKLPFFNYKKKPFCYIWKDKKTTIPYVTFVRSIHINRPNLELGKRKAMKAISIDPNQDIDVNLLNDIMAESITYFK